ncbi:BQ2448_3263 [Microbotryum intermedium]|uniref:BQ2448_3263 protein n=1 Tax=Microbotryum intermedium TaxID=269621 RepID=A0A238FEQ1_9BASI|nr:BQ2448_3263 [Microbotryum intermedium]
MCNSRSSKRDVDFSTFLPVHLTTKNGTVIALNTEIHVGFCGYCRCSDHLRSAFPILQAKTHRRVVGLNRRPLQNPRAKPSSKTLERVQSGVPTMGWRRLLKGKKHPNPTKVRWGWAAVIVQFSQT